jgi:hypothetical protein
MNVIHSITSSGRERGKGSSPYPSLQAYPLTSGILEDNNSRSATVKGGPLGHFRAAKTKALDRHERLLKLSHNSDERVAVSLKTGPQSDETPHAGILGPNS